METIIEFIIQLIFEYILSLPGAIVRWLYLKAIGKPKTLNQLVKDNPILNGVVSVILIIVVSGLLIGLINK